MSLYYPYSAYLKNKYGKKTYKLPVNLPVSCPNRDGNLGTGGCAFCGEEGAGFETLPAEFTVREQLEKNRHYIGEKYGTELFIAYFQNFSNTYLPLEKLKDFIRESLEIEGIVEISLSTRPDCVSEEYMGEIKKLISKVKPGVNLSLEMGLQTVNYHTLSTLNRGHTLAEFIDALQVARKYGIEVGTHLILNLPGDDMLDVMENARILSALKVDNVKLHALYIREDTELGRKYLKGLLKMISLDEYIERVITFLEYLDPGIAVQRLLGRAPEEKSLFANWDHSWWKIQDMILKEMERRGSFQGKKFNYLNGKALRKFQKR
ncbi:MAG: TIGR01212 family radical SAM protein [Halanaerobiaceae bacterium]|nr:TIGR01212 family radical SAM protein [Halanaerobiaceae bacterium]